MRRPSVVSFVVAVLLGACVADRDAAPSRISAPESARFYALPGQCDFDVMNTHGRTFLVSPNDDIFPVINLMRYAYMRGGAAATNSLALDALAKIAKKRLTSAQRGTAADGAVLINDILDPKCSTLRAGLPAATTADFDPAAAIAAGLFEVRGGPTSAPAAVAFIPGVPKRTETSPRWGIEPAAGCTLALGQCAWPSLPGSQPRYLLFGYPTTADLRGETPAAPTTFAGKNGFVLGMIPDIGDKSVFTVGACIPVLIKVGTTPVATTIPVHATSSLELLANKSPTYCAPSYPTQAMLERPTTWFGSLADRARAMLSPSLLFAQDSRDTEFGGGGPSGWSPISFARLAGSDVVLTFGPMPTNGVVGGNLVFTVHATTPSGHALPGVIVTVAINLHNGPAGAILSPGATPLTVTTNASGDADFSVVVNRIVGYNFKATGSIGGFPTGSAISKLFNVQP